MPVAFDFNEVPGPSADEIKAHEGQGALVYGTGAQQAPEYIAGLESAGLHVPRIWEHNTDSILGGYAYGVSECQIWEATHPPGLVYLACDLNDGALGDRSPLPFCQGWSDTTREPGFGVYGPDHFLLAAMASGIKGLSRFWGVVNWIDGGAPDNAQSNVDFWTAHGAHLVQMIGSTIGNTDLNLILKPDWWTTGEAEPEKKKDDDDMNLVIASKADPGTLWNYNGIEKRHITPSEWQFDTDLAAFVGAPAPKPTLIDAEWFNSIPIAGQATVDVASLSALLVPALKQAGATGLTKQDVHDALVAVLHSAA